MPTALISGISGQDGSYLTELLLDKGYIVHGVIRRASTINTSRIDHLYQDPHEEGVRLFLHYGDLLDGESLRRIVTETKPDEVYHLGAQSHVAVSFEQPEYSANVDALGTLRLLEAVRHCAPEARVYIACSSEMFGGAGRVAINEDTPLSPRSPYAVAKVFSYQMAKMYREAYGMWVANGILFNHESPRRGHTFVTQKICQAAARIAKGEDKAPLYLGNLSATRDWGYAPEYVEAMWKMLQLDRPYDFVIGTGESHSVGEWCRLAFETCGLDMDEHVKHGERYVRPLDVPYLEADYARAFDLMSWGPTVRFQELVVLMTIAAKHA